jgi:hypothetical protein
MKDIKMNQDLAKVDSAGLEADEIKKGLKIEPCSNCGANLNGPFCHSCGQSSKSMIKFFGAVIKELLDDTLGYDSRLKHSIVPLLFKPGRITLDYIKGKRSHYVLPFKLYLITSVLFILVIKNIINTDDLKINEMVNNQDEQKNSEHVKQEIDELIKNSDGAVRHKLQRISKKIELHNNDNNLEIEQSNKLTEDIIQNSSADDLENNSAITIADEIKEGVINEIKNDVNIQADGVDLADSDGLSICNQGSQDVNITWDSDKKRLIGLDNLSDSLCKTFAKVVNPKLNVWIDKPERLVDAIIELLPYMMFLILPLFAIFMKIFYVFSKRYYTEHLVFLLHNHSFIYLVLMLQIGLNLSEEKLRTIDHWMAQSVESLFSLISLLLGFWLFIYVFLAMKRFYRQGWAATIFKTMSLGFIYTIMLTIGFVMALAVGAYQA